MKKLRFLFLHLLLLVAVGALAKDFTTSYYTNANGKKGEALKTALCSIITSGHTSIGYDGLYESYKKTDNRVINGTTYVRDWYSTTTRYKHVTDKAGSYSKEGDCYNREHSVPQSWWEGSASSSKLKCDIVHVLPTDGYVNNRRSNYPFGEVGSATYTSNGNYCKLGTAKSDLGYSGTVFEPNDEIKGDIARIYFYMCTRYQSECTGWSNIFTGTTYSPMASWALNMFMRWSENDPVDDIEIARNNAVEDEQGNRNPFVDFPGLEQYVWGDLKTTPISVTAYDDPYDTSGLATPTFTFNTENVTVVLDDVKSLTYQATTNSDATVQYTSSNTSVATISSTGVITILTAGTTIITASVPATNTYKAASASFILTVKASADDPDTLTGDYVKVTSADDLTDGQYLIVCESQMQVLDGTTPSNHESITISDNTIASNATTDSYAVTIASKAGGGYSIKGATLYIGHSGSSNSLNTSQTDDYTNTISVSDGDVTITCNNRVLKYNASGAGFFRYYTSGQTAIQLYKKTAGSGTGGDDPTPTGPVDPTVSFTTETLNVMVGDTIVNEADTNSDGMITYTSSNPQVATVDSESGEVIAIAEGTATITASVPATNDYNAGSASYTLTVIAVSGDTQVLTDEITATMLELSGSYSDVSGKTGNSGTIYAANAMKNSNSAIQMRTNNSNSGIVSTYSVGNVSKVTVTWGTGNMSGRTLNIYGSSTPYTSPSDLYDSSKQGTLIGTIVYGTSTELSITSASYPYIGIRSSNSALYADKIKVEWVTNEQSQTEPIAPVFSFENQSANMLTGETYTQTVSTNSDGDVTYSSSNTQVATVDATTGEVTALAAGTATITASVTGTNIYTAATASYTITVEAAPVTTGDGTATNPYTVADIQLLFSRSLQPSDTIFVRGYVSQIVTIDTSQYGNANYYISDDATTTSQFYVYRGKYLDGERFTSADQLAVGDSVVVKGKVTLYNNQTAEFTQNNYLVSHYRPGETQPEDPTLDVEPAKVALNIGETVQLTVTTNSDGQVTYESEDTSIATVSANGLVTAVSSGVAGITISVAATNTFNAATTSVPVTVVSGETPDEPETLLYEGVSGYTAANDGSQVLTASSSNLDYDGWTDITKVYAGGTSNSYDEGEGGCLKFGSSSANGSITTSSLALSGNGTLTFYLKQYNTDTGKLNVTVTGATADVTQFTPSSSWTLCTVNLTDGNGAVTITFATSSKRVYLDEIKVVTGSGSESGDEKEDIELQFTETAASATLGEDFTAPSLSANTPVMPVVTYESSDPTVATVDAQTGAVTLVAAGTTVITATFAGDDYYNPATASYTLTVSEGTTPVEPTGDYYYVKVTETPNDWSGTYLIVYEGENESLAFDGSLSTLDATGNTVSVTISNDTIASTQATDAAAFTIARIEDPTALLYSVQSASGKYIGNTSDANALKASATSAYSNSISLLAATETQPASVGISSSGTYLRYNPTSGQTRFRYFKSSTYTSQQPIQLYQKVFVPSQEEAEPGDVDGDDDLDEADLDILVQILIGNLSTNDYPNADVDGENGVTLSDITRLVNLMRQQQQQSGE